MDIHLLHRRLVHIRIGFDRLDEFRNALGTLLDLADQRFQIQSRLQPAQCIHMACWGNLLDQFLQPGQIQPGSDKSRREVPCGCDTAALEPLADNVLAVAASEMIKLWSFPLRSFLGSLEEILPMLWLESLPEPAEKKLYFVCGLFQMRSRPTCRCRRIVEFVRETCRHRAKRNQFFPLPRIAFQVAHAI